jgi:hypothetical protein
MNMDDPTLDTLLRRSAPSPAPADPAVEANLLAFVDDARHRAQPARRRRRALWFVAIPAVPALALALTAGIDERLSPDLTIPVTYTTDTGYSESCSIFVFNGEVSWIEVSFTAVDYLSKQNWDGIGERIYQQALIEEAAIRQQVADRDPAVAITSDGLTMPDESQIQQAAWNNAEGRLVSGIVPTRPGDHWGGDTDCSGRLH